MTDFKPGDVVEHPGFGRGIVQDCLVEWGESDDYNHLNDVGVDLRRLVVIDPEDREQVERLMAVYTGEAVKRGAISFAGYADKRADSMQAALREFATPTPPRPDKPTGLGAVVEDAEGHLWVQVRSDDRRSYRQARGENVGRYRDYADITAVRVLSEGVTP